MNIFDDLRYLMLLKMCPSVPGPPVLRREDALPHGLDHRVEQLAQAKLQVAGMLLKIAIGDVPYACKK